VIFEIAELKIKTGQEESFTKAVEKAAPNFKQATGCQMFHLYRGIENPSHFKLMVGWDSVEAHTEIFRNSEGFQNWRGLVSEFFADAPEVVHVEKVIDAF
jgi:quinol monooxygenase YgiN